MILCKNCEVAVAGNFCPNCGQKADTTTISIPNLLRDLPQAVFHINRGFLYNIRQLFVRPGQSILDYLAGKRKPFFHPASYLVIALIFNYLVVRITDLHFYDLKELYDMDPIKAKAITDYDALQWWFLEHTYLYILIAIPASTLFLFAIFKPLRHTYNFAETAVIVLFTIAQGVLIQSIIYLCLGWTGSGAFNRTIEMINVVILVLYASTVLFQLLNQIRSSALRVVMGLVSGFGLAVVWVASAYLLYFMMT